MSRYIDNGHIAHSLHAVPHAMIEARMTKCRALHESAAEARACYDERYAAAHIELESDAEAAAEAN